MTEVGTEGGVPSTVTVVSAVEVPLVLEAKSVYTVVEVGFTRVLPMRVVVLKEPGVMDTEEAFVTDQESVEVTPGWMREEDAVKEETVGATADGVTLPEGDEEAEVPTAFVAVTVKVYEVPFVRPVTVMGLPVDEA